ncbi:MAG TPA: hypothetical protein VNL77_23810, partial [Roseiflexaceae bacterium]|nr:hypothetical protein [Roseiflexaceae bacterium]
NLTVQEREELAAVMRSLVSGIDKTLKEVGQTVKTVSGVALPFDGMLDDNEDIRDVLEYISDSLTSTTLTAEEAEAYDSRAMARYDERQAEEPRQPQRNARPSATPERGTSSGRSTERFPQQPGQSRPPRDDRYH